VPKRVAGVPGVGVAPDDSPVAHDVDGADAGRGVRRGGLVVLVAVTRAGDGRGAAARAAHQNGGVGHVAVDARRRWAQLVQETCHMRREAQQRRR